METGKPTYVICSFPFRPGGHASDQNPSPPDVILDQFKKTRDIFFNQIVAAAPKGSTGAEIAEMLEDFNAQAHEQTELAILRS